MLEDGAGFCRRSAAEEVADLAARVEIRIRLSFARRTVCNGDALGAEPLVLPYSAVFQIDIDAGRLCIPGGALAVLCKLVQDAASQFGVCRRKRKGDEGRRIAGVLVCAVVFVERAEVAVDIHLFCARGLAVCTCIHKDGAFFGEQCVGVRGRKLVRRDLAAVDGDPAVSARLQTDADDIHIEIAAKGEARVVVLSAAASCIDAAHVGVCEIRAAVCALRRGRFVLDFHRQFAAHGQRTAVDEGDACHLVALAAACYAFARNVNEDVARPDIVIERLQRMADRSARFMLFDFLIPAGRFCRRGLCACAGEDVFALPVRFVADAADLEGSRRRCETFCDLHLAGEIPLAGGVVFVTQLICKGVERIVDLCLFRRIGRCRIEPCLVRRERERRAWFCVFDDEIAAEYAAVCIASIKYALMTAVVVDGDGLVLALEDRTMCSFCAAADELSDLAARIEIRLFVRTILHRCRPLCPEPAIFP